MFNGYLNTMRAQLGQILRPRPEIPNPTLGVEESQSRTNQNLKIFAVPPVQATKIGTPLTMDDTLHSTVGRQFSVKQFPKSFYIGEAL